MKKLMLAVIIIVATTNIVEAGRRNEDSIGKLIGVRRSSGSSWGWGRQQDHWNWHHPRRQQQSGIKYRNKRTGTSAESRGLWVTIFGGKDSVDKIAKKDQALPPSTQMEKTGLDYNQASARKNADLERQSRASEQRVMDLENLLQQALQRNQMLENLLLQMEARIQKMEVDLNTMKKQ